ncbi:hypothetical protein [Haloarcula montana]|uniref:hypothetical protein n=1 Tax=Haloarcula montana TaxID=3111776 RepID=UPI002D778D9D|nr:hypothetical protein [Haloarcula sp. GH36]
MGGKPGQDYPFEENVAVRPADDPVYVALKLGAADEWNLLTPAQARQLAQMWERLDLSGDRYELSELIENVRSTADAIATHRYEVGLDPDGESFPEEDIERIAEQYSD